MEYISTKTAPDAIGPYSQAVVTGGYLFTSGQIPLNPETNTVYGDNITTQARRVCQNLSAVCAAAGTSLDATVKTTCYLADMADFAAFNDVYAQFFTQKPARSCVAVKSLPKGVLCEIDLIAKVPCAPGDEKK